MYKRKSKKKTVLEDGAIQEPSSGKYGAKKVFVPEENLTFDSKMEWSYWLYLKELESQNKIKDLTLQPKFLLQEGFAYNGKKIRPIYYIADFQYIDIETGKTMIMDVKGQVLETFKLKIKMFKFIHRNEPDIVFSCVKSEGRGSNKIWKFFDV